MQHQGLIQKQCNQPSQPLPLRALAMLGRQELCRCHSCQVTNCVRHTHASGKAHWDTCIAAILGSEVSWLLGRSGLVGSPDLSAQPGIWNGACCLGKPRCCSLAAQAALCFSPRAQGAVTWGTGYMPQCLLQDFSAVQRLQVWLWTNGDLAAQEMERWESSLMRKLHCAAPYAAGKVEQVKLRCLTEYMLVVDLGWGTQWKAV